ncbi:DUF6795 domain-containing protein [Sinobacterium norvegicum]|nr:DUF6795 domain-containing protein [Sinobacterium norvegicum]
MSIFDIGKSCVFSPASGVLTLNGQPISNAKITRMVEWQKTETDETTTDENGYFQMPGLYHRSATSLMPVEFVASQSLVVEYEGQEYKIWSGVKRSSEENAELGGAELRLSCELTDELKTIRHGASLLRSNCNWND